MSATAKDFAVAIVNWNTRDLLASCLTQLQHAEPGAHVWVLDNGSTDGSARLVRDVFPSVHLLRSPVNLGFAGGVNRLLEACPSPYIVLFNTDAVPEPGALSRLRDYLVTHPYVAAVGPRLLDEHGRPVGCHDRFPTVLTEIGNLLGLRRPPTHRDTRQNVDWIGGACFMVSRIAVRDVGLLDTAYFMYCEEMDWCRRAKRRDWRITCLPDARVTHAVGASGGIGRRAQIFDSKIRYQRQHGPKAAAPILAAIFLVASAGMAAMSALTRGPRAPRTRSYLNAISVSLAAIRT